VRKLYRTAAVTSAAALTALAAAGCSAAKAGGGPSLAATAAYVQQPAATGKATVGYLDIRNNGTADQLLSVTTSAGGTVSLRGPVQASATPVVMHTVADIPVPAHAMTQLVPNSYHLLITGAGPMHDGKDITLKLTFAHGGTITVLALVTNPSNGGGSYFLN
jgi:copper(I)-binding protein